MGTLKERIRESQAAGFQLDAGLERILANEKKTPGTIAAMSTSERLRIGHYQDNRAAYLSLNGGKLPAECKQ